MLARPPAAGFARKIPVAGDGANMRTYKLLRLSIPIFQQDRILLFRRFVVAEVRQGLGQLETEWARLGVTLDASPEHLDRIAVQIEMPQRIGQPLQLGRSERPESVRFVLLVNVAQLV